MPTEVVIPLKPGQRLGFFSWKGCNIQVTGPKRVKEFVSANSNMKDLFNVAAIIERKRLR